MQASVVEAVSRYGLWRVPSPMRKEEATASTIPESES
jgi:hypothetical protein